MQKNNLFLKGEPKQAKQNIIFIDSNSLVKTDTNEYTKHDITKTKEYLSIKYNDCIYEKINTEDLAKFFYDIDNISVGILTELLELFSSSLVITSKDNKTDEEIKSLFRLYGLDNYIKDIIRTKNYTSKSEDIKDYVTTNNIDNYIVFDEYDYTKELGHAFRRKSSSLRIEDIKYSELLFNKDLKVIQDDTTIRLLSNNQEIISLKYVHYKIHNLNILYLKLLKIYNYEYEGKEYIEYLINYLTMTNNVDYLLLDMNQIHDEKLNISGALDHNNIYTINKTYNDTLHLISECKRKILTINEKEKSVN